VSPEAGFGYIAPCCRVTTQEFPRRGVEGIAVAMTADVRPACSLTPVPTASEVPTRHPSLSITTRAAAPFGLAMLPAMEHRFFGTLTIVVVAGVTLLLAFYGMQAMFYLILSFVVDD
jgi:hypothetical protein